MVHSTMGTMNDQLELKVYFDGLCRVCSGEISHYKKQKGADRIAFVDICAPNFDAKAEGLDPLQVHKIMHVRRKDGTLATRVDAFIEIWRTLPRYRSIAWLASRPAVHVVLEFGYTIFAFIRPWLPRKKGGSGCEESPYCETKND